MLTAETITQFANDERGQGVTEYGAILAFVSLLVALVFALTQGDLQTALSQSFSSVVAQLDRLNNAT